MIPQITNQTKLASHWIKFKKITPRILLSFISAYRYTEIQNQITNNRCTSRSAKNRKIKISTSTAYDIASFAEMRVLSFTKGFDFLNDYFDGTSRNCVHILYVLYNTINCKRIVRKRLPTAIFSITDNNNNNNNTQLVYDIITRLYNNVRVIIHACRTLSVNRLISAQPFFFIDAYRRSNYSLCVQVFEKSAVGSPFAV